MDEKKQEYYPIMEKEISFFVKSSGHFNSETRSLAQQIYARSLVSLSTEPELIKDLQYQIYKLKKESRVLEILLLRLEPLRGKSFNVQLIFDWVDEIRRLVG